MIIKNTWDKYDRCWVIGDICVIKNPDFRMGTSSKKHGNVSYHGLEDIPKFMEKQDDFIRHIYIVLNENIEKGIEAISSLELAVQCCISMGMFDEDERKAQVNECAEEIKNMTEEKDGFRYHEILAIIGGDFENISAEGMEFIKRRADERLIKEHAVPKYLLPDDKIYAVREFYANLRFNVTMLIQWGIFEEIGL